MTSLTLRNHQIIHRHIHRHSSIPPINTITTSSLRRLHAEQTIQYHPHHYRPQQYIRWLHSAAPHHRYIYRHLHTNILSSQSHPNTSSTNNNTQYSSHTTNTTTTRSPPPPPPSHRFDRRFILFAILLLSTPIVVRIVIDIIPGRNEDDNDDEHRILRLTDQLPTPASLEELSVPYKVPKYEFLQKPIDLLFTSDDPNPHHQLLERLVRSTQQSITQHIMDIENDAVKHTPKHVKKQYDIHPYDQPEQGNMNDSSKRELQYPCDIVIRNDGTGGGIACVYQNGYVFQKAGVSTSISKRVVTPAFIYAQAKEHSELKQLIDTNKIPKNDVNIPLFTASISLVIHPRHPSVPTVHANYRYFQLDLPNKKEPTWWYGGGSDLTPNVVDNEDAKHFHSVLRNALNGVQLNDKNTDLKTNHRLYGIFKKWCDDYFFIRHRNERRGVGGIFFDDLHSNNPITLNMNQNEILGIICGCAESFNESYFPLVKKHMNDTFTQRDLEWQQLRRGRYVEFNLVYDRGTTYGLTHMPPSMARPDAVLMSLPLTCRFQYHAEPRKGTAEERTIEILRNPVDWV